MIVSLIAALSAEDRGIGWRGAVPWHLPKDLARFRRLTMGHALIVGRRTYESLAGRELPGRRLLVISRASWSQEAALSAPTLEASLQLAGEQLHDPEPFIAGGSQVFAEALAKGLVDRMYLTLVHAQVRADAFFPEYSMQAWRVTATEEHPADASNPLPMTFQTLERADHDG